MRFGRHELAGAVADIGVLLPIALALIVMNGLSATAVLLPAGLLYIFVAYTYNLPIPVQPLKAFGAIAIAKGLGSDEIAAGALLLGAIFLLLGRFGIIDRVARIFPKPLIRGVQLAVGLLFLKIAWKLVDNPSGGFAEHALDASWAIPLGVAVLAIALALKRFSISLILVCVGAVIMFFENSGSVSLGPSALSLPSLDGSVILAALTALVIPQLPLTFANSCVAASDAARTYFGEQARKVTPGRLAQSLGVANLFAGSISGMPVCHGAGGLTAHHSFGARTGGAPLAMGAVLVALALGLGAGLGGLLTAFPLPILAGLLSAAGLLHMGLLRDLESVRDWVFAISVGIVGLLLNLAIALVAALAIWWLPEGLRRLRILFDRNG